MSLECSEKLAWTFERSTSSHFMWFKPGIGMFPIPVHKGLVKYAYVREIEKLNQQESKG